MEQKRSKVSAVEPGNEELWTAGGPVWINFANTIALKGKGITDVVASADALSWWMQMMDLQSPVTMSPSDLDFASRLRESFLRFVVAIETDTAFADEDIRWFNSILQKQHEWFELSQPQKGQIERRVLRSSETIEQAFGPAIVSLSETLMNGDHTRLRVCAHHDCQLSFYDDSKNGARRWCTMSICGNRAKAAAFLRRQKVGN